jgi:hypothetical protein
MPRLPLDAISPAARYANMEAGSLAEMPVLSWLALLGKRLAGI